MSCRSFLAGATLGLALISSGGCFLVAAGAGAGAAIAYTNRGASANLEGNVNAVFDRAVSTFSAMGIAESGRSTADNGAVRTLEGKRGDVEVTVEIRRSSESLSAVEVVARKSAVDYDRDYAKSVLDRIVRSG